MGTRHGLKAVLATLISLSLFATPALANPGNGNGNGNSGNHGNNSGNHGNKGNAQKGNAGQKNNASSDHRKNYGKPDHVDSDISFATARHLAVNYGLTGYDSLPPGIAKNLARGKPLPPGIAKKTVPASMLGQLPYYPGYEWKIVGDDLVLIALSTAVVTAIINGVFD
ncbi:anti-virulence regulator CigR family protein [Citrobacter amalonaticus]|uniref:anti-virulence regulator CigR family protein n=1 Tax=Citrobacter amalonaticus TaxID=35703 RepID=UPI00339BB435